MQAEETQKSTSFSEISLNFLIAQTLVSSYAHLTKGVPHERRLHDSIYHMGFWLFFDHLSLVRPWSRSQH
jgi:hypothetical protein